jgi:hypothetical protein
LSPGSWAILVLYAYNVMDYPVDFLSILGSNLYACFFKNLRKMPKVTRHGNFLLTLVCWRLCKIFAAFDVTNATGISINIPPLNREFIKIMGINATSKLQ